MVYRHQNLPSLNAREMLTGFYKRHASLHVTLYVPYS